MLISCPECGHKVSDKAISCVECGYPIKSIKATYEPPKKRKYKRLPNGTGSIKLLKGNLRKPYAAYLPVTQYKENGTPVQPKALGYFETRTEALQALMEWHNHPYNVEGSQLTFKQVADAFLKYKHSKETIAEKTIEGDKNCYKHLSPLYDKKINALVKNDLQSVINNLNLKNGYKVQILSVMHQIMSYAMENDYIQKDYSQFVKVEGEDDSVSGIPYTEEELKILWKHRYDNETLTMINVMIYTGYRRSAYRTMEYNTDEWYMKGGVKNKQSKGRIVPIHPEIKDLIPTMIIYNPPISTFKDRYDANLKELGILYGKNKDGEEQKHTPHDTRHTFSWLCDHYKVDEMSKHMLMGHTLGKDVEANVYGHRTLDELKEAINQIKIIS